MPPCTLDHLVITSPSLRDGIEYVQDLLGVTMSVGGKHQHMGTHNMLLRLDEATYLEVIAVDPEAPSPQHRRWFNLDGLDKNDPPRLRAWVARTASIDTSSSECTIPLGTVVHLGRDELHWFITVPASGLIPLDGVGPALIQWTSGAHPAERLPASGASLEELTLHHPSKSAVDSMLASLGNPPRVISGTASLAPFLSARVRVRGHSIELR